MQDPIKRKKLYDYLKSNQLTDLSFDEFSKEYATNKDKTKKLYSYLKSNQLTDLNQKTFYNEYFGDVKKKDVGGVSKNQKASSVSVGEIPVSNTQQQIIPKNQITQKEQQTADKQQYNPNLPDNFQTLKPNPNFNENQPESVFNPKYIDNGNKPPEYKSVLEKASNEDLKLLNDFEKISKISEPEQKSDPKIDNVLGTMYADNKQKQVDNILENSYEPIDIKKTKNIADELSKQIINIDKKQKDFIKALPKEKQDRLLTLVKAKKFETDVNLKLLNTDIQDIDKELYQKTEHIKTYKEQLSLLEQEKEKLKERYKTAKDVKPLEIQLKSIIDKQKQLEQEQIQIGKEALHLYNKRLKKAVDVENYKDNIGLFNQELDLLKRNWGTLDNITNRLMLGTRGIVDAFDYERQKEHIDNTRQQIKKLIQTGDLSDPKIREQIPPQYLIGQFNEKEFDKETQRMKDNLLREIQTRKEQYQNIRQTLAPEIHHISDKQDFVDYTLYNLSNAAGTLAQFAIPIVGEASGVISTKLENEIDYRTSNLEIKDKLKEIDKQLQTADNKQELEKQKKELQDKLLSETQIELASGLSGMSFVALSRLGGYAKQLAKGRRILSGMTESELQPYIKTSIKKNAKVLFDKGLKATGEVLKETAEGTATMGAGLTMTNNAIQHFIVGKKDVGIMDGVDEAMLSMANLSGVLAVAPRLVGMAVGHITSNNRRAKVYTNTKKIAEYKKALADENISDDTKNLIFNKIKKLNEENKNLTKTAIKGFDNLDVEDKIALLNLSDRAKQLEISIAEINRRKNPTNVELELKSELEKELQDIDKEKDFYINKKIEVEKDGKKTLMNKSEFKDFLNNDENVKAIKQGTISVNINNYNDLPKLMENKIKQLDVPKKAVEFAKAISDKTEIKPENKSVVIALQQGKTEIKSEGNAVEIKGEVNVDKAVQIADEQGVELKVDKPKDETKKQELEKKGFVEQDKVMVRKPETETINIPIKDDLNKGVTIETEKDTYTVKVKDGQILIEPKYSAKVTDGERKKVIEKFVSDTNFDNGKNVDLEGVNPADVNQIIADKSQNPYEVAQALKQERENKVDKTDEGNITKQQAIAIELQSGVDYQDYRKHGSKGKGNATSNAWFKKDPSYRLHSIESVLERLQANYPHLDKQHPFNISDITDFIESVPRDEYQRMLDIKTKTPTEIDLEQKFEKLTGLKADEKTIDKVLKADEQTATEHIDFNIDDGDIPFQTHSKYGNIVGKALKSLVDKLKLTNLAKGVHIISEQSALELLDRIGVKDAYLQSDKKTLSDKGVIETPNGFVYKDTVYLVREKVKADTPIHEFGHLWNKYASEHLPDIYKRGIELIKDTKYYKDLENHDAYKNLSEERKLDEALAQYIGERGARIVDESKKQKLARWFTTLFRKIGQKLGFTGRQKAINDIKAKINDPKTSEVEKKYLRGRLKSMERAKNKFLADMTVEEYVSYVAGELLAGEPLKQVEKKKNNRLIKEANVSQIDVEVQKNKAIKETRDSLNSLMRNKKTYSKRIKQDLKDYIDKVTKDKSISLTKQELDKLLSLMKNSNTKRNLEKAIKDVDRIVFKAEERATKNQEQIKDLKEKAKQKTVKEKAKAVKELFGKGKQANERVAELKISELKKIINLLADNKKSLNEAFGIIDNIVITTDNRKLEKDINKILSRKLVGKQSGKKKANRVAEEQAKQLLVIKEYSNVKKQEIPNKLKDINDKQTDLSDKINEIEQKRFIEKDGSVEEINLTEEQQTELENLKRQYRTFDLAKEYLEAQLSDPYIKNDKLNFVYENIKSIYETGKDILEQERNADKEKSKQLIKDVIDDIDPNGLIYTKEANLSLKKLQDKNRNTIFNEMVDTYLKKGVFNLRTLFTILSRKGYENWDDSPLIDLENRLTEQYHKEQTTKRQMLSHLNDLIIKHFKSHFKADKILNKSHNLIIKDNEIPLTTGQLLNVWMNWHNKDLRPGLKESGFTDEVVNKIDKILPENVKNLGNDLFKFYDKYYDLNNETYRKMMYMSLPKQEFYAGKVFRAGEELKQETPNLLDMIRFGTTAHGSLKSRVKNDKPIEAVDVLFLAKKYINETAHYNAFAEIHREYSRLFRDKNVKKAIELTNPGKSKTILDIIKWYREMYMENGGDRGNRLVQAVAKNVIQAQLQLKTKIGLTQIASFLNGFSEMPKGTTLSEYLQAYASIPKHLSYILKDDYIKNRYGLDGFTDAITGFNQIVNSSNFTKKHTINAYIEQLNKVYEKLKDAGMSPVKIGDFIGIIGTIPVYDAYYRKYKKIYSEDIAREKALKRWRSSADRTQQTTSPFRKSKLQHHPFARYFMMYQTAPIQNFNNAYMHYLELNRAMKGQGHKGSNWKNAYGVFNYQMLQPLLYTWLAQAMGGSMITALGGGNKAPNDLDKDLVSSAIVGNAKSLPLVGLLLQNAVDIALKKEKIYGVGIPSPLQDSYNKMVKDLNLSYTAKSERTRKKHLINAIKRATTLLTGTSSFAIETITNDWKDIYGNDEIKNEVKFLRALGYPLSVIKQKMTKRKSRTKAEIEEIEKIIRAEKRQIHHKIPDGFKKTE